MADQIYFDFDDFSDSDLIDNPTTRTPVCLCLDTSSSMSTISKEDFKSEEQFNKFRAEVAAIGKKAVKDGNNVLSIQNNKLPDGVEMSYDRLKKAVHHFLHLLAENDDVRDSAEVGIVTFDDHFKVLRPIACIGPDDEDKIKWPACGNNTAMGDGLTKSLNLLDVRKKEYKEKGVDYFQPLLVLISDGIPNGNMNTLASATERIREQVNNRKLSFFAIYVGKEKERQQAIGCLEAIAGKDHVFDIGAANMLQFFEHLSKSVSKQAMSYPGEGRTYDDDKEDFRNLLGELINNASRFSDHVDKSGKWVD